MKRIISFFCFIPAIFFFGCDKDNPVVNQPLVIQWEKIVNNRDVTGIAFNSKGSIFVSIYETKAGNKIIYSQDGVKWDSVTINPTKNEYIKALYINERDEIFIAGHNGMQCNLYCSKDDGKNWTQINLSHGLDFKRILSVGNKLFISSGFHDESAGGIYYTTNYGVNWTECFRQFGKGTGKLILLNDNTLMDLKVDTLMLSTNEGQSWQYKEGLIDSAYIRTLEADVFGNVYASTYKGVYRSGDKGSTWIKTDLSNSLIYQMKSTNSGYLFAADGIHNYENPQGVYCTTNRGITWNQCNDGLTDKMIQDIAVDEQDYVYVGTVSGIFKTTKPVK